MVFDRNLPAETTVCGMSSRLVQVTVVPTFTVSWAGSKVKLSICTSTPASVVFASVVFASVVLASVGLASSARTTLACRIMAAAMARPSLRITALRSVADIMFSFPLRLRSALQRRVDDRKRLAALLEIDAGDAEHGAKLGVLDLHRSGRGGGPRRRLREGGRARGVEGDVAFDLLHHLVDVAVQHGDRAEALDVFQRASAVLGAPAPLRIHRPQRGMGEQHDRGR